MKEGHFLKDDIAGFDAPFFSMSPDEAAIMDPLQRWLLEITYEALENGIFYPLSDFRANTDNVSAGITLPQINGSRTSVFIGSFLQEYETMLCRDTQLSMKYKSTGTAFSMLANRLSWFYDLKGPSVALDTACSSSMSAFHLSCQSIKAGDSDMVRI